MKFAYYDSKKDKIYNCKRGSLVWWHEKGHQYRHHNGLSHRWKIVGYLLLFLAIVFSFAEKFLITQIILIILVITWLYEDLWCWNYGLKNWLKPFSEQKSLDSYNYKEVKTNGTTKFRPRDSNRRV